VMSGCPTRGSLAHKAVNPSGVKGNISVTDYMPIIIIIIIIIIEL